MPTPTPIDRPPRIQPELPVAQTEIPRPPNPQEDAQTRLAQIGLPLVTIIGYVLVSALGGSGRNPWLLLPMALSVVASTAFSIYTYRREQQRRAEADRAYANRLAELNKELHQAHELQRRFYDHNYPDPHAALNIARLSQDQSQTGSSGLRSITRLWERRVTDADFGFVRLGIGTLPSTVVYTLQGVEEFSNSQARAARKLADDSRFVTDVPVTIALRQPPKPEDATDDGVEEDEPRTPFVPSLAVAGQSEVVYELARALLSHTVIFHAPADVRLFICAARKAPWEWAGRLPHCRPGEQGPNLLFLDAQPAARSDVDSDEDEGERERFFEGLRKLLAQRKIRLQGREENQDQGSPTLPFCLVVVDMLGNGQPSPLGEIETDPAISILLEEGASLGAAVLFLVNERSKVPGGCRGVIEVEQTTPNTNSKTSQALRLHFRYTETGVNSFRYVGIADQASLTLMSQLSDTLAALDIRQGPGSSLPAMVSFLDLEGFRSLGDLRASARQYWSTSDQTDNRANWLKVRIGRMAGNKTRRLVFSAKRDGVHGIVAGSTGSGKSELLISLISGLAVNYSPATLNFVLVDYKGGGAFSEFAQLPHCVDIITNLAADGVTRMFTAITAEMQRRQRLNVETRTKNIVEYRRKGYHRTVAPYPFLFIIIDEFAEMIADQSEYKSQLESITRVGRAQGVSLILAAQRPSGVTDQMRSNIKFRICLRVETPPESREMLRRPDAAYLPPGVPGRGYLQVGNENIELIQVAYSGDRTYAAATRARVVWPDRGGEYDPVQDVDPPELYKAIVTTLADLAQKETVPVQRAPWPRPLPTTLALSQLLIADDPRAETITASIYLDNESRTQIRMGQPAEPVLTLVPAINRWLEGVCGWVEPLDTTYAMRPVIGLVDNPYAARQIPLVVDLQRGHAVVFGASGWGKSTFLRTLVVSLAATHSPNHYHAYILDLGGRSLSVLGGLPHLGALITPDEGSYKERVTELIRRLNEVIEARKQLLSEAAVESIYEYNRTAKPEDVQPGILVVIDNFLEFVQTFNDPGDAPESVLEQFTALARQARPYGVHLVLAVGRMEDLPSQLVSLFTERFTLKLADPSEYRAIVGGSVAEIGDVPGRGYTRVGIQPLAFQVALPLDLRRQGAEAANEIRELERLARTINDYAKARGGFREIARVDALPKEVLLRTLLAEKHQLHLGSGPGFLPALRKITTERWAASLEHQHARWLEVPIGRTAGGRMRELKLEAKEDGVHAMVAGGTGSGKSELLMTLIVGLALNYSPEQLNFVLVDFKGGGAFKPFEMLPHCVDVVTNLNRSAVHRMFTAIGAEIRRRQALNAEVGVSDIVAYRKKNLHKTREPYPHLVIIIDEYAEMIDTNPEYRQQLDSITRVGRSLGINLILASQRPRGVTDQMRANIKLRLCLRVEEIETSREMLRRPDAALLPSITGRGVLQVGNKGGELIQVAYTGAEQKDERELPVIWADRPAPDNTQAGEVPRFFDVVVSLARNLARKMTIARPWHSFLPNQITLEVPITDTKNQKSVVLNPAVSDWINGESADLWPGVDWSQDMFHVTVGLVDDPEQADQRPLTLDLGRNHLAVFGDTGSGKSSLLRTIIVGLATTHSPDELHIYALDLGGRGFRSLEELPHLGTVIYGDEDRFEERLQRLVEILSNLADVRQRLISDAGCTTLAEYNARYPSQTQPALLVLIDGFEALREGYETLVDTTLLPLVRRSLSVGISFVVACNGPNSLSARLYNLFSERLTFSQTDPDRYMDIVGRGAIAIEDRPGRGYVRASGRPLLFQAALPVGVFRDSVAGAEQKRTLHLEAEDLGRMAQAMVDRLATAPRRLSAPDRIHILDGQVALATLLAGAGSAPEGAAQVAFGLNSSLAPLQIDLQQMGPHFVILGPPMSGKTTALRTWALALAYRYSPEQVRMILVDLQGRLFDYGGKQRLNRLPHVLMTVSEPDEIDGLSIRLEQEAQALKAAGDARPQLFILVDNFEEFLEAVESQKQTRRLTQVARGFGRYGLHFVVAGGIDPGSSDLRRSIMAPNFGIGLRTAPAVEALKVLRTPSALRGRELPMGRGYLVKSGQATMIQIATPYPLTGAADGDEPTAVTQRIAVALDDWYSQVRTRTIGQKARWLGDSKAATREAPRHASPLEQLRELLQFYARYELSALRAGNGHTAIVIERILLPEVWNNPEAILDLARQVLVSLEDPALREVRASLCAVMREGELVDSLRDTFQKLQNNGTTPPVVA